MISEEAQKILIKCNTEKSFLSLSSYEKTVLNNEIKGINRLHDNNKFLGKDENTVFWTFNLPCFYSCPEKTAICAKGCYQRPVEAMIRKEGKESQVVNCRKLNWYMSTKDDFSKRIFEELSRKRKGTRQRYVRIHASGDFYSKDYMSKWLTIALASKLKGLDYIFCAYTKSFSILEDLLSDQQKLKKIYEDAYNLVKIGIPLLSRKLEIDDFNIHIIASVMDDTKEKYPLAQGIIRKYNLPVYKVTSENYDNCVKCGDTKMPCVKCMKCYTYPMCDVVTRLRESK